MNEEHTALVATLDCVVYPPICADAASAIRALAGEVERLKLDISGYQMARPLSDCVAVISQGPEDVIAENTSLRAEVDRLKSQVACLEMNLHHEQDGRGQR